MPLWMINRKNRLPIEVSAPSASYALHIVSKYYNAPITDYDIFSYGYIDPKKMNNHAVIQKFL